VVTPIFLDGIVPANLGGALGAGPTSTAIVINTTPGSIYVILSIDVVFRSGVSGDTFVLQAESAGLNFFSGTVGLGINDHFPWRGMLLASYGGFYSLTTVVGAATWDVTVNGFVYPDYRSLT
jgi:hypothetical protein